MNSERHHIPIPLHMKPLIHQAGLGQHGSRSDETFFRPDLWALHLYFWQGALTFDGQRFDIHPHNISLTPPGTPPPFLAFSTGAMSALLCPLQV